MIYRFGRFSIDSDARALCVEAFVAELGGDPPGTARAIRSALALRRLAREQQLACGIGVHVGECLRSGTPALVR
jgi:class 3 adenylate cyclase